MRRILIVFVLLLCAACLAETGRLGEYGQTREYDGQGRLCKITYLDSDGNPALNDGGYAVLVRSYDEAGRIYEFRYYDADGNPARTPRGAYGQRFLYDTSGNPAGYRLLDADGTEIFAPAQFLSEHPLLCAAGFAALIVAGLLLPRRYCAPALALYTGFVMYITLFARHSGAGGMELALFSEGGSAMHMAQNVVLFVPIGLFWGRFRRGIQIIAACCALSAAIEAAQYIFTLGYCEINDVLTNTLGAAVGWALSGFRRRVELTR